MTTLHACACGYEATSAEDLHDHMAEMFTPDDNRAPDGQVHAEAAIDTVPGAARPDTAGTPGAAPGDAPALACLCGYQASSAAGLDAHLADVFTPADRVGRDGFRHLPASPSP